MGKMADVGRLLPVCRRPCTGQGRGGVRAGGGREEQVLAPFHADNRPEGVTGRPREQWVYSEGSSGWCLEGICSPCRAQLVMLMTWSWWPGHQEDRISEVLSLGDARVPDASVGSVFPCGGAHLDD